MPLIVSQEVLADGMRITCSDGTVFVFTSNDLPTPIRTGTVAACETFCNNHLASLLANRDFFAKVHVLTVVPLSILLMTSNSPLPDFPNGPWARLV